MLLMVMALVSVVRLLVEVVVVKVVIMIEIGLVIRLMKCYWFKGQGVGGDNYCDWAGH